MKEHWTVFCIICYILSIIKCLKRGTRQFFSDRLLRLASYQEICALCISPCWIFLLCLVYNIFYGSCNKMTICSMILQRDFLYIMAIISSTTKHIWKLGFDSFYDAHKYRKQLGILPILSRMLYRVWLSAVRRVQRDLCHAQLVTKQIMRAPNNGREEKKYFWLVQRDPTFFALMFPVKKEKKYIVFFIGAWRREGSAMAVPSCILLLWPPNTETNNDRSLFVPTQTQTSQTNLLNRYEFVCVCRQSDIIFFDGKPQKKTEEACNASQCEDILYFTLSIFDTKIR